MLSVADLHSKILDAPPPPRGSKFFQFHAVFGKFWRNRMLAPPPGSWRPLLGEILDPPLVIISYTSPIEIFPLRLALSVTKFKTRIGNGCPSVETIGDLVTVFKQTQRLRFSLKIKNGGVPLTVQNFVYNSILP